MAINFWGTMTVYHQPPITPTDVAGRYHHSIPQQYTTHSCNTQLDTPYNNNDYIETNYNKHNIRLGDTNNVPVIPPVDTQSRADSGLHANNIINNKWNLISRIGCGAFGDIWLAEPTPAYQSTLDVYGNVLPRYVAIKIEKLTIVHPTDSNINQQQQRAVLKLETIVLKSLQKYSTTVSQLIEYGKDIQFNIAYLVMSLLGENLLKLRKKRLNGRFSLSTVLRFGISAIKAIQAIHSEGYIHRDIKPSNFVIGNNQYNINTKSMDTQNIYMIDFGLARAYRDRHSGAVLESRGTIAGFRGTPRYASVHVHQNMDLGRRDDLWSLLYILIEFLSGDLPWGQIKDKDAIGNIKQQYIDNPRLLLKNTTSCLLPFIKHLQSLEFTSQPNYDYLISLLYNKYHSLNLPLNYAYDWEINHTINTATTTTTTTTDTITYNNTDMNYNHQSPSSVVSPMKHRTDRVQSIDNIDNERTLGKKQLHNTIILPLASPIIHSTTPPSSQHTLPSSNVILNELPPHDYNQHQHRNHTPSIDIEPVNSYTVEQQHANTVPVHPSPASHTSELHQLKDGVVHMKYCDAPSPSSLTDMNHTDQQWGLDEHIDQKQYHQPILVIQDYTMESHHAIQPRIYNNSFSVSTNHSLSSPNAILHTPTSAHDAVAHKVQVQQQLSYSQPQPPPTPAPTFAHITKSFGRFAKKLLLPTHINKHRISPTAMQPTIVS